MLMGNILYRYAERRFRIFLRIILQDPAGLLRAWQQYLPHHLSVLGLHAGRLLLLYLPFAQQQLGNDILGGPAATPWLIGFSSSCTWILSM